MMKHLATLLVLIAFGGGSLAAQVARPRAGGPPPVPADQAVSPAEVQRMFDAYALMQAQEQLNIADDQFSAFLTRFKALQDARRQMLQQRARALVDIRRLLADSSTDEAQIKDRLKQLQEIESRGQAEARKAYDAIDQVLDLRQQAQFRIFEEQMERRKVDLLMRARQGNRLRNQAEAPSRATP